jgi:hypothetical protein
MKFYFFWVLTGGLKLLYQLNVNRRILWYIVNTIGSKRKKFYHWISIIGWSAWPVVSINGIHQWYRYWSIDPSPILSSYAWDKERPASSIFTLGILTDWWIFYLFFCTILQYRLLKPCYIKFIQALFIIYFFVHLSITCSDAKTHFPLDWGGG